MKIVRPARRPEAALRWLAENGLQDVATENILEVRNEGDVAVILLDGSIGKSWWDDSGITAKEVHDAINEVPAGKKIKLLVNSEGGSVKEGLGIYDRIEARKGDITCRITGYALSIASVFPLAAGRIESPDHAIWMTHEAWSTTSGNKRDKIKDAAMLEKHDASLVSIYAKRTGKSEAYWAAKMEAETWLTGSEAIAEGLADDSGPEAEARAESGLALRPIFAEYAQRCRNIPENILNCIAPKNGGRAPAPAPTPPGNKQTTTPQDRIMNKKVIVALLLTHGIKDSTGQDLTETSPDAEFETALNTLARKSGVDAQARMDAIEAKLVLAEKRRITDKVNTYVDAGKITKAEVSIFVAAAITDEPGTIAILDAKEVQGLGGDAAGFEFNGRIEMNAAPQINENGVQGSKVLPELNNIYATHKTDEARYNALKREWPALLSKAFRRDGGVQAANTFSATVTTNFLIAAAIQKLSGRFAAANLFARDNAQDPFKPLAVGIQKFNTTATDGTQVQTNATDFEALGAGGDSTIDAITITPAQLTSGGHITNAQLQSGFRVADIIEKKLIDLAAKVTQVLTAPINTANFTTNAAVISAPAAFGFSDLATLQGILKKTLIKNLILDGEYQARIANTPGFFQQAGLTGGAPGAWKAFGWDNIALNTDWSGAGANVRGFACGQDAIGFISGLPVNPPEGIPGNIINMGTVMLPDVNIGIATYAWFSALTRTFHFTFDLIIGASLVDETQGVLIKSA